MAFKDRIELRNVIKNEARGIDDTCLDDVQKILGDNVITRSNTVAKEAYTIPRNPTEKIDCYRLLLSMTKKESKGYKVVE